MHPPAFSSNLPVTSFLTYNPLFQYHIYPAPCKQITLHRAG